MSCFNCLLSDCRKVWYDGPLETQMIENPTSTRWSPFAKGVVVVALLLAAVWLLGRFDALLRPLITALIVAYLLNLPVTLLTRRTGMSRTQAAVLVYLVVIVALVAVPALIGPWVIDQVAGLPAALSALQDAVLRLAAQPIVIFRVTLNPQTVLEQVLTALGTLLSPVATSAFSVVANTAEALGWLLIMLVVSFLLIKDLDELQRSIAKRIPVGLKDDWFRLGRELNGIWDAFLRGRLILSIVIGLVFSLLFVIIGMPAALLMGVLTGALAFIPSIGSVIAGVIAAFVALARGSTWIPVNNLVFALIVVGLYILLFQLESLYLLPRIVGRRVQLHPVVVIVGTIAGALVGGVLGIFLAAPVIASGRVLLGYTYSKLLDQDPFQAIEEDQAPLPTGPRGQIDGRTVEAVLFDLDGTLIETDDQAVAALADRLKRVRLFLPQGDPQRAARRLVMWSHDGLNGWLALMDRIGLDAPVQRLAQRAGLLNDAAEGKVLTPVAGASDLLRHLCEHYQLAIVSTRRSDEVRTFLNQQGLNGEIQVVVGSDTTRYIKPHPQPLQWAIEHLGVTAEHTLMVGDTRSDLQAAKAAGTLAVAVLCGFGERSDFGDADLILESTVNLVDWL
jgi:predicted PurR-regulated permease PerM/phosphoglycolate phosphatase-like HAD superfamily hydrolase